MGAITRRRADHAGRLPRRSPGRPPVGRREHRAIREAIARGLSSEDAGVAAGVSPAVGTRWFRDNGGMPSSNLTPLSGRYLSFGEREEIAIVHAQGFGIREIARRSADVRRRSRGNCVGTPRPVVATCGIEPQRPSGTPTGVGDVRKSRSSPRTANCATMCKTDSQASSPPLTEPVCLDQRSAGSVGGTGPARSDAGRGRGVRSRLLTGSASIFPRMIRCGSPTRPSTRRSTCKAAVHCDGTWSRVCGAGASSAKGAYPGPRQDVRQPRDHDQERPKQTIGQYPGTGKGTCSSGWPAPLSAPWSSARPGSRYCCTCRMDRYGSPPVKNGPALAGHGAKAVRDAIASSISTLPEQLRRSLTWDQGAEMAQHATTSTPAWRSSSATHIVPGSAARMKTLTACCASTARRVPPDQALPRRARGCRFCAERRKTLGWKTAEALDALNSE